MAGLLYHIKSELIYLQNCQDMSFQRTMDDPKKASSIYDFTAKDIDGNEVWNPWLSCQYTSDFQVSLSKYKGHVCVIVNVASKWGKTDVNYK